MSRISAALRPVPDTPERAIALVRVSKEREGMVSPEIQRSAIEDYAAMSGYQIVQWVEGLDESGSSARSAWWQRLDQAVATIEAGECDVVLVWKFSRAARHRLRWAVAIDRVETAGGRLESATEQFDTGTSSGRLARGMLAELQAFEAERIGEVWREVHERRVRHGKPPTGKPKWGYTYDLVEQIHRPDPATGPALAECYRRYVAGESVYALARWLNDHGYVTLAGGVWRDRTLRRVMDSGFAAGVFSWRGDFVEGVHEALISRELWQDYRDSRNRRRSSPRRERSQYLLSGLVWCARCERKMVANRDSADKGYALRYRCGLSKEAGPEVCRGGYVMARFVEAAVMERVAELAEDVEASRAAELAAAARRVTLRTDAEVVVRELRRAEEALRRLVVQHAQTPMPSGVFDAAFGELQGRVAALEGELEGLRVGERRSVTGVREVAAGLLGEWDELPVAQRRELLGRLVSRVWVRTGRVDRRIRVVMAFEDDAGAGGL